MKRGIIRLLTLLQRLQYLQQSPLDIPVSAHFTAFETDVRGLQNP